MNEQTGNVSNRFDKSAASWDAKDTRVRLAESVAEAIRREVKLSTEMDLLDFGCGTGLVSLPWAHEVASLTGADNSAGMVEVFMDKAKGTNLGNVRSLILKRNDHDAIPGAFDLILSSMAFHHVKDVQAQIRVLYDALKPGGQLCIADLDPDQGLFHADNTDVHHFGFERELMMTYFRSAGFSNVRAATVTVLRRVGKDGMEREFSVFLVTGAR